VAERPPGRVTPRGHRHRRPDRTLHRPGTERNALLLPAVALFLVVLAVGVISLVVVGANKPGQDNDRDIHIAGCRTMFPDDAQAADACIAHLP